MLFFDLVFGVVDKGICGKCFDVFKLFLYVDRCENFKFWVLNFCCRVDFYEFVGFVECKIVLWMIVGKCEM